jgi:hypothetical protein
MISTRTASVGATFGEVLESAEARAPAIKTAAAKSLPKRRDWPNRFMMAALRWSACDKKQ